MGDTNLRARITLVFQIGKTKRYLMTHLEINKPAKSEVEPQINSCLYCREPAKFE